QDFYSFSRRENRRIASYVTVFGTQKMEKKTSQVAEVIKFSLLTLGFTILPQRFYFIRLLTRRIRSLPLGTQAFCRP
ncbi:hypothetical protein QUF61_16630, partial [Candidatus Venteria ishoeyi]|uniref:hypothetical protein n=1 Tax=Candidatus Venteria ishoeyi TaxID=1899563 RepID=UPI0025A5B2CC